MTDIVERLRDHARTGDGWTRPVAAEAADEIERLRAGRDRLREAVQWFIDNDETNVGDEPIEYIGGRTWNEVNAYYIDGLNRARAALKETDHD
jgi:hypothetical protein